MSEPIAKRNIYDKNGVLLLAKGQKATETVIKKLKRRGGYEQEAAVHPQDKVNESILPIAMRLGERLDIRNVRALEDANKILSTIIFESKSKPWWIFVNALTNYVDWLYTHSIDVAVISLMMAVELKFSDKELWNLGLGAFFHDVGKLLIPKSIILKPMPLNDMEMVCIRQHCDLGMTSLAPFNLPGNCTDIVLQHHERLDGSGYPKGLVGDEICRNARIVMVADAIDAITSGRPYKDAKDMDTAIKILRDENEKYPQELIPMLESIPN